MEWDDILQRLWGPLSIPSSTAILAIVLTTIGLVASSSLGIIRTIIRPQFSPLRALKGPGGATFLYGHLKIIRNTSPGKWQSEHLERYGPVFVYKAWLNTDRLLTIDARAMHHILSNSMIYRKPEEMRFMLSGLFGEGLLFAEGHDHKRQRRVVNPAFGVHHLRDMTEIFITKSIEGSSSLTETCDRMANRIHQLREALLSLTNRDEVDGWIPVEMLSYLSCTALDIIGLAGFDYSFDSIHHLRDQSQTENELSKAFRQMMRSTERRPFLGLLRVFFPPFRLIDWDARSLVMKKVERTVKQIGQQLVNEKRQALQSSKEEGKAKDLLTLLIKANINEGGGNEDRGLSDREVLGQIPTFLIAGHETSAAATAWALYSLAIHPDIQHRLRKELLTVPTDTPTMDELSALPYLDRFVRETLRYHSVVSGTVRIATQDDIIPVGTPYTDRYGKEHHSIRVAKGDGISIAIRAMNQSKDIWGPDAEDFNPDRWLDLPSGSASIPGVWGNQLSFLGGPRSCIGFRFALAEIKALLFVLIRSFEFKLAVPADDIVGIAKVITRPAVRYQLPKGFQLPMLIRKIK